ncbi:glycosyltransferase family 4 protein [Limisalsivibrio acetivorans]|uniref:glycosyltransferase family 4 protein n=1 Tax=Limisalsivibrio acetivorans TaxID=1304888 RepID=UPI0003B531D1|nr:glycosyltransferase family 4 protein [Limisalsivibrio acetivorans]
MRVLHVDTGREWRGGQRQALFLHRRLPALGIESFLAPRTGGELARMEPGSYPLPFRSEADPSYILKLNRLTKELKPDIVHSHDSHSLTPCIACTYLSPSVKLVHTRRVDFPLKKKMFNKYLHPRVHPVAISRAVADIMINGGVDREKLRIIHSGVELNHGIDEALREELRQLWLPDADFTFGSLANFADHKDYPTLLKAFSLYAEKSDKGKLLLVGDGPLFDEMKELASTLPGFDRMIFTGFSPHVHEMLSLMDLFVITSKTEGLCTTIIDAMNSHLPVLATEAGGIPELVKDGVNGLLCPVGDAECLASAMERLVNNEGFRGELADNAPSTAADFSADAMASKYAEYYRELVNGG